MRRHNIARVTARVPYNFRYLYLAKHLCVIWRYKQICLEPVLESNKVLMHLKCSVADCFMQLDMPHRMPGCQDVVLFVVQADHNRLQSAQWHASDSCYWHTTRVYKRVPSPLLLCKVADIKCYTLSYLQPVEVIAAQWSHMFSMTAAGCDLRRIVHSIPGVTCQ